MTQQVDVLAVASWFVFDSTDARRDVDKGRGDRKLPRDPNDLRYNLSRKRQGVMDAR